MATTRRPVKKASRKKPVRKKTAARKRKPAKTRAKKNTKRKTAAITAADIDARIDALASQGRLWLLDVPFTGRGVAKAYDAKWDPVLKQWFHVGPGLPAGLQPFAALPLSWQQWRQDNINGSAAGLEPTANVVPRSHQADGIEWILWSHRAKRRAVFVGDDMGLGKTFQTILALLAMPATGPRPVNNILITCPSPVVETWRRSWQQCGTIGADGIAKRVCILSHGSLVNALSVPAGAGVKAATRRRNQAKSGKSLVSWDAVVADESHKFKDPKSLRSRALHTVWAKPSFKIPMTGTAGISPLDVFYVADAFAAAAGFSVETEDDLVAFFASQGIAVVDGAFGVLEWDDEAAGGRRAQIEKCRDLLFTGEHAIGFRRTRQEVGWEEPTRELLPIRLDYEEMLAYESEWELFDETIRRLRKGGLSPSQARNTREGREAHIRFLQKASLLRVPHLVAWVNNTLESGVQVAVSLWWRATVAEYASQLEASGVQVAQMHGGRTAPENEADRLRFQRGEAPVVLFTPTEGISLHQGETLVGGNNVERSLLVGDPRWSPFPNIQVEGRTNRDGYNSPVHYSFALDTGEAEVIVRMFAKVGDMRAMQGDDEDAFFDDLDIGALA